MVADAWPLLNAPGQATVETKGAALREKLARFEVVLSEGPYFAAADFTMVDVVAAPIFRFFDSLSEKASAPFFEGLPRVAAWRSALRARDSVKRAVGPDYADRLTSELRKRQALLAG
nr:glutathione S-transferase domain-containing protein [Rhizobium sp. CF122]